MVGVLSTSLTSVNQESYLLLGAGSRGPVRLATVDGTGECVAVKLQTSTSANASPCIPDHPNIVGRRGTCVHHDRGVTTVLEMRELAAGGELFDETIEFEAACSDAKSKFPLAVSTRWFAQMASALAHMHTHSAPYGQLRPELVLLSAGFDVKMLRPTHDVLRSKYAALRPPGCTDAPELLGRTQASVTEYAPRCLNP